MYNVLQRSPLARVTIIFLALMPAYGALSVRQYSNSTHFQTRVTPIDAMTPHQSRAHTPYASARRFSAGAATSSG
jgi:hypothetical protein